MGCDKARILLDGETLVVRAARLLAQHTSEVVLASGMPTRFDDLPALAGLRELADAKTPADPDGRRPGPLAGLVAALDHAVAQGFGGVLYVACDLVRLGDEALVPLARALQEGADVALWVRGDQPEPLCAAYSVDCAPRAREAFEHGERRMIDPWKDAGLRVVQTAAPSEVADQLENVNTPEDGRRLGLELPGSSAISKLEHAEVTT